MTATGLRDHLLDFLLREDIDAEPIDDPERPHVAVITLSIPPATRNGKVRFYRVTVEETTP